MFDKIKQPFRLGSILTVMMMLNACTTSITVTGHIPSPLVPKVPLTAEVIYTDEFQRYNYEEQKKGRPISNLAFGEAQVTMFNQVLNGLLDVRQAGTENVDLRITPKFLDLQYSSPRETSLKLYEVWLKYRVKITDGQNNDVADWVIKGYGKTPTAKLGSAANAFNLATNLALRDAGAQLAIGFDKQKEIKGLLTRLGRTEKDSNVPAQTFSEGDNNE